MSRLQESLACDDENKDVLQQFSYSDVPLLPNEIRLFVLLPSPSSGPVRIRLSKSSVDELPEFTALSYAWGKPDTDDQARRDIFVGSKVLKITRSLETALRALQTDHAGVISSSFWADQICINQADDASDEKGMMLPHMATIYRRSTSTIAWLGEETSLSAAAMTRMDELGREAAQLGFAHLSFERYRQLHADEADGDLEIARLREQVAAAVAASNGRSFLGFAGLDAILELHSLPYFARGWVKEEIALPRKLTFQWGSARIDGDVLRDAVDLVRLYVHHSIGMLRETNTAGQNNGLIDQIEDVTGPIYGPVHLNFTVRRQYQSDPNTRYFNLAHILRKLRHSNFTKKRDRVYGVFALANDRGDLGIPIRFTKSVPCEAIFTATAKRIIQKPVEDDDALGGVNFIMLCASVGAGAGAGAGAGKLPSWVPDLEQQNPFTLADETRFVSAHPFNASRGIYHSVSQQEQDAVGEDILLCSIVVVDRIKQTGHPWRKLEDALGSIAAFALESRKTVTSDPASKHPYRADPQKLADAQWRVPIIDHEFLSNPSALQRATAFSREGYAALLGMKGTDSYICNKVIKSQNYLEQLNALRSRQPFLGEKGFVGIGPIAAQRGDLVCVIQGGAFPFVLREVQPAVAEKATAPAPARLVCELVGEAYCDGIMDGEAFHMGLSCQQAALV